MNSEPHMLTVFPTEAAKRRFERSAVIRSGILDASRLFTQKKLQETLEQAARADSRLEGRKPSPPEMLLLIEESAASVSFAPGQPIAPLPLSARAGLLEKIIESFAPFAVHEEDVTGWMIAHAPDHKLHGIGQLLNAWRTVCTRDGIADRFEMNRAVLRLIESGNLPSGLQNGIRFRAVRWFNPFEEQIVAALKKRLGQENVQILSALPGAHAEAAEDRLCAAVRSELMRGAEEEWKPWLEDFADAFGADDSNIPEESSLHRVSFCVSAHPYGEIEDSARQIVREIEAGTPSDEIALIVRDLGPYADIIPDVFSRFGLPYHFRRGAPSASFPAVKALLALLTFPQSRSRDRLCDLLRMPGLDWPGVDDSKRSALVHDLRNLAPPILHRLPYELQNLPAFKDPGRAVTPEAFAAHIQSLIRMHGILLPDEVSALIEEFAAARSRPIPMERLIALFEKQLDDMTVKDTRSTEGGVWVINPMDAAGLRFRSVWIAGMNADTFPQIPKADSLLNDTERKALRAFLAERNIPCPRLALSETGAALIQEEILFLTAMGTAQKRLSLSYSRTGSEGKELSAGEFFERMRALTRSGDPVASDSFHTILPPHLCRAEDEIRQTKAKYAPHPPVQKCSSSPAEPSPVLSPDSPACAALHHWLKKNPEFSATALESLARNRYVFFLERILGITADRMHEDSADPLDRGSLIHSILEKIYTDFARQSGVYAVPDKSSATWKLSKTLETDAIPLAVFDPARIDESLAPARTAAEEEFKKAETNPSRRLGHPAVWETEKRKIRKLIENFVRMDTETALSANRYPALFELKFGSEYLLPLKLEHNGDELLIKGKIDRIDMIFDREGRLARLLVIDYKGASLTDSPDTLRKKIALNLDCQLPLYTFAAQERFFGAHNTSELNEKTGAVYHLQERSLQSMTSRFHGKNRQICMTPDLTEAFFETLFSGLRKLRAGDLATEPLIDGGFEDWSGICRTLPVDPKELVFGL